MACMMMDSSSMEHTHTPGCPPQYLGLETFKARLRSAVVTLSHSIQPLDNLACLQVWMPISHQAGLDALHKQLYSDPQLSIIGCAALAAFRLSSCQTMQLGHQGMPGRALRSGCVQVVQNLRIIPEVLHPRCRLPDAAADEVGEVVYVPVYDLLDAGAGPVAVLEALLSARATDSMMVANFISVAGNVLASARLSLSNPLPQPVRRSKLEGRKPRPVHDDSYPDLAGVQGEAPPCAAGVALTIPAAAAVAQHGGAAAAYSPVSAGSPCRAHELGSSVLASGAGSPQHQQQLLASCSSASASTLVAAAGTPSAGTSPADGALASTLSSRLSDIAAAAAAMPPPRPHLAGTPPQHPYLQHRRPRQPEDSAAGSSGSDEASPPPCKLRRTLSMVRTKSVPMGLDQVLAAAAGEALPSCELAASC